MNAEQGSRSAEAEDVSAELSKRWSEPQKVHKSAICIVPPEELWGPIQDIRRVHDKHYKRWMPHINLIYPFWVDEGDNFQVAAERAVAKLSSIQPFQLSLKAFNYFQHNRSCTMWLDPTDATAQLQTLQAALQEAFPKCTELSTISDSFKPHLSVGQWRNKRETEEGMRAFGDTWPGLEFTLKEVFLISRADFDDPFHKRSAIPLGAEVGASPKLLWTPATSASGTGTDSTNKSNGTGTRNGSGPRNAHGAEDPTSSREQVGSEPSTSGQADLVWNFAYGANVNKHKLEVVRRITPVDSVPGRLAGYRLAFNHRGAMGNVVESPGDACHGLLHQVTREQFNRLREMENGYSAVDVDVEPYDGRGSIRAVVFCSRPEELIQDGLPPSTRYLNLIKSGAKEWGLHPNYVAWLDSLPAVDAQARGPEYWRSPAGLKLPPSQYSRRGGRGRSQRGHHRNREAFVRTGSGRVSAQQSTASQ
ncbi:RNA ligase/cyclic nucleotide phosphodiesterase [Klebsormidium nitens]|uniref:RNA ligase/cyclic nucleotide phosphodiesterase n=1 Tax=Klebsormidium nitens TaxID=105231 RepID=A0A1Y1HZF9_KLENI|nr:RNA ligase/cyclic nucleotide phosphodiesterase [Klebsormidium nitens]|eukprot:GAQ83573.1 RNA ligase/cyclic nucleotide phosphodiesterase [Klebsormidium nitens]